MFVSSLHLFNYCCVMWDNCSKTLANKLRKLQNRAARYWLSQTMTLVPTLSFKNLAGRNSKSSAKFKKMLSSLNRFMVYLLGTCILYLLRDTEKKLAIPKPRTNYLKDSFSYTVVRSYEMAFRSEKCGKQILWANFELAAVTSSINIFHTALMESRFF